VDLLAAVFTQRRGSFDRVLADSKDEVAPDCERALFGLSTEEFFETVPQSFFEGLAPIPVG
jgi:hypothetical protein